MAFDFDWKLYLFISFLCVALILLYGSVRCTTAFHFKDPLLTKFGIFDLDGWSVSHVLFYILLGYLFPDHFILLMFMGILWELMEEFVLNSLSSARTKCDRLLPKGVRGTHERISDIPMNAIGFIIGVALSKKKLTKIIRRL